jgi:hypothetical protein
VSAAKRTGVDKMDNEESFILIISCHFCSRNIYASFSLKVVIRVLHSVRNYFMLYYRQAF